MGMTLSGFEALVAPLQLLVNFFSPPRAGAGSRGAINSIAAHARGIRACGPFGTQTGVSRPLRVLRMVEPLQPPARAMRIVHSPLAAATQRTAAAAEHAGSDALAARPSPLAGRMVISGRMSDVCAELDRLAAQEQPALQICAPMR